jgi:hypothetical protein
MTALTFPKPQLIRVRDASTLAWHKMTDHNRGQLSVDTERIEKKHRMANGLMRKYVIADKLTFSLSWENVPDSSDYTVDGFMGALDMESFWSDNQTGFTLELALGDGTTQTYTVMFSRFDKELKKRGAYDLYSVSLTMEEV